MGKSTATATPGSSIMSAHEAVKAGYVFPSMIEHGTYVCSCGKVLDKCACKLALTEKVLVEKGCHECWQRERAQS